MGGGTGDATARPAPWQQSPYIQSWRPPDIFSYLSHIAASRLQRHAAQGRIRLEHVDNPADAVKFRRSRDGRERVPEIDANERSSRLKETKMAVAEEKTSPETSDKSWHGIVLQTLKRNEIRLVPYVPDRVLTPLIKNLHAEA